MSATLTHPSSAATTVTVAAVSGSYTVGSGSGATIVISAGSTTSADTATIAAVDNDVDAADNAVTVTGTAQNSQGAGTVTGASLTITDDDEKGLAFARAEDPDFDRSRVLEVAAGSSASYTVALASEPTGPVTVRLVPSDRLAVTVNPASLTFTTMGTMSWNTAVTVTVAAAAGDGLADPEAPLSHRARDGGYDEVMGELTVAVADGTRIAVPPGRATRTENVYVVNGQRVTVTVKPGVLPGVEIALPSKLGAAVAASFATVKPEVPRESARFSLAHGDERVMVDVSVDPMPKEGVTLCLAPPAGMRDAARRVSGRGVKLLRYTDGSWTAVTNSDSDWDESRSRVCAIVTETSPFAAGYADTEPKFDTTQKDLVFTVDEEIEPSPSVTLPAAKGGDGTLRYTLTPKLPPGVKLLDRLLFGTPEKESGRVTYTWTATDGDDETVSLTFDIEVRPALAEARARLKSINESILPELSRSMWGSVVEAVTVRLEGSGPGGGMADTLAEALRAHERTQDEEGLSWRKVLEGRTFAVGLGAGGGSGGEGGVGNGGSGSGGLVLWGGGSLRSLSLDKGALDWSGDLFAAHMGVDAPLGERLRGGLAASWFEGEIEYTDRSGETAIKGTHESRMTALHPYLGWSGPGGSRLWGALGYGNGEIEIADAEVMERFGVQKGDSEFVGAALGGSVPVLTSLGGLRVALKGSGEATRYSVDDNGEAIAAVSVDTHRLRLSAEGSRAYALSGGGLLTPSLEVGARWDGGDGETGAGVELGAGLEWALPSRGLVVEARGRTLAAHAGAAEEWGVSGSVRLSPGPGGRGLSFELSPRWGASESGVGRLWSEGVSGGRASSGVAGGDAARAGVETELGYGLGVRWGEAGVLTPYGGFGHERGEARRYRLGARLELGPSLEAGLEAGRKEGAADPEHDVKLSLRLRW